jgi:hypothetical protein
MPRDGAVPGSIGDCRLDGDLLSREDTGEGDLDDLVDLARSVEGHTVMPISTASAKIRVTA